jgi:hypothetical protein
MPTDFHSSSEVIATAIAALLWKEGPGFCKESDGAEKERLAEKRTLREEGDQS